MNNPAESTSRDIHVYPLNDLKEHITIGIGCPCEPTIKVEGAALIIVHNSFDHREIIEQVLDILNGEDTDDSAPVD